MISIASKSFRWLLDQWWLEHFVVAQAFLMSFRWLLDQLTL